MKAHELIFSAFRYIIAGLILLPLLVTCSDPLAENGSGTFSVTNGSGSSGSSRTTLPWYVSGQGPDYETDLTHNIQILERQGEQLFEKKDVVYGTTVSFSVTPGWYTIEITAYNNGGLIADGSTDILIKSGKNGSIPITMGPPGGNGTPTYPFKVATVADLQKIGTGTDGWIMGSFALGAVYHEGGQNYTGPVHYRQTANINLSGVTWTPIGTSTAFSGNYDGNGYTISNLANIDSSAIHVGLFGEAIGAEIKNIRLTGVNISVTSTGNVGGVVGENNGGTVENCSVSGSVTSAGSSTGGVVGLNRDTTGSNRGILENCYVTGAGKVEGDINVGGVTGFNHNNGTVQNCYSTVSVTGNQRVGGVAGSNNSIVQNCYSTGNVISNFSIGGGIVGDNSGTGTVKNSYSMGRITGDQYVGGAVGNNNGDMQNCYSTGSVEGANYVGGATGQIYNGTVENCVALNPVVKRSTTSSPAFIGRIIGYAMSSNMSNNYARMGMAIDHGIGGPYPLVPDGGTKDGENITAAQWGNATWWQSADYGPGFLIGGGTASWEWSTTYRLPILRNMPGRAQDPRVR